MDIYDNLYKRLQGKGEHYTMERLYYAMKSTNTSDMSPLVLVAKDIINKSYTRIYQNFKEFKISSKSNKYRNEGNEAFSVRDFKRAFECYNKALLYAPKKSQEKILAYSNRSAVLLKVNAIPACLNDIAICLSLNCTEEITKKLVIREDECKKKLWFENLKTNFLKNSFTMDYFKLQSKHPHISSISSEIDIIMETKPKIVAAKDIKAGTVVSFEKSFVSQTNEDNLYTSCYYCQNMSLNLMPCDGCCYALFCSDKCKQQCYSDYHETECIYNVNILNIPDLEFKLMLKAVLKMKNLCKSWEVFNEKTQFFNTDMTNQSLAYDNFNVNSVISVINNDMSTEFIYGKMFNASLKCAHIITELCKIPYFFPTTPETRNFAICSFARVMMHLIVFPTRIIQIYNSAEDVLNGTITTSPECDYGWLSFTSKLKHACDANLLVIGINNNVALVTTENIKAGTELTISYIGQWYEIQVQNKPSALYKYIGAVCSCRICKEHWTHGEIKKGMLNENQRTCYRKWKLSRTKETILGTDEKLFRQTCNTLNMLRDMINTEEYHDVYSVFRSSLSLYQTVTTNNIII